MIMDHEYTDEYYENWDDLQSMKRIYAKNYIPYPKCKWRKKEY